METIVDDLGLRLAREEKSLERRIGEARLVAHRGLTLKVEISNLDTHALALDEAIGVLNSYADTRQAELQRRIETLLTHGLQTIFGEDMTFRIKQSQKGKYMTADFVVRSKIGDETVETSVLDARGGGVAAVAGFLLRLIILLLKKDSPAILFLDESFSHVSANYLPSLAEFLKELTEKTGTQIVLVTHSLEFVEYADTVYKFSQTDGATVVEKLH